MKTLKIMRVTRYFGYILLITVTFSCRNKKVEAVKITNEVIEVKVNCRNMTSYCDAKNYKIAKLTNGKYAYILPHGTISFKIFNTIEEAQKALNEHAKLSYDRWIESGGYSF